MVKFGDKVRFVYKQANNGVVNPTTQAIKEGKIIDRAKSGGFLIKVIEGPGRSSHDGTICNRAESDIIEVI